MRPCTSAAPLTRSRSRARPAGDGLAFPRVSALAASLLIGCASRPAPSPDASSAAAASTASAPARALPSRGRLTLAIVVDQLPLWHVVERIPLLPPDGGFARLIRESEAAVELRYGYAQTSTAMGHSALFSGLAPHESTITANELVSPTGGTRAIVADATTRVVAARGQLERSSASLAAFAPGRETFADALRRQRPEVSIACLSMKDRGAIFACGRHPDVALWFDTVEDAFVTSSAVAMTFPAVAGRFGERGVGAAYRARDWEPLDAAFLAKVVPDRDRDVGQGDFEGLGKRFPHRFATLTHPARAMLASPMADELLLDAALTVIDALPEDRDAYVAISFSAYDYVHHVFGAAAPESWDELLRLDGQIARLLRHLDERRGPAGYGVVLSSDHGGPPPPESAHEPRCDRPGSDRFERPCVMATRLDDAGVEASARRAAESVLGPGTWIAGAHEGFVVFSPAAKAAPPLVGRA